MVQPVQTAVLVLCLLLPILATASVCLRFYARRARKLPLLADDWSVVFALIMTIAASILSFYGFIAKGLALAPAELPPQDFKASFKSLYAILLLIYLDFGVIKISIILFYKRIFVGPHFRIACNVMMAAITCWTITQITIEALNSWNIPQFWNEKLLNYHVFHFSMAVLALTFDVSILLLPLPIIYKLQMDNRRKYWLVATFLLGSICIVSSSLRVFNTHQALTIGPKASDELITYNKTSNGLWLIVEANISIIAASLPTLSGFLKGSLESRKSNAASRYPFKLQKPSLSLSSDRKVGKRSPMGPGDSSRDDWIPLRDVECNTTIVNQEDRGSNAHGRGIMVEKTFVSENIAV